MRRTPVILLILLILLSLGGAWTYQLFRKAAPTFAEIDSFLRHEAAPGDWRFRSHESKPSWKNRRTGWWDHLRIRRYHQFQQDDYTFVHPSGTAAAIVWVIRKDGKVTRLQIIRAYRLHLAGGPVPPAGDPAVRLIDDLEKLIRHRFPASSFSP